MDHAKIFLFEDYEFIAQVITERLQAIGHEVVAHARTVIEAEQFIDLFEEGSLDLALLDGNFRSDITNDSEGADVAAMLNNKFPGLEIVGMSTTGRKITGTTKTVEKDDFDQIQQIIAKL